MTVVHVVQFQFKPGTGQELVQELVKRMLSLKERCIHPKSGKAYIKDCAGGRDNSVQGLQNGITHLFVVTFENTKDRDYYALEDPVHLDFVRWSDSVLQQVQAADFINGEFGDHNVS